MAVLKSALVRIGLYVRVSTANQAERHHPLEVQDAVGREWAHRTYGPGNYVITVYVDPGVSGGQGLLDADGRGRPGLTELVKDILAVEVDVVWVQSIDRLTRDPETWSSVLVKALMEGEAQLWTSQGRVDPANLQDRLVANIMVALGEFERLQTGVKVKAGLRKRAQAGYPPTKTSFGWRWERRDGLQPNQRRGIEPVPEQREHVLWMVARYVEGAGAPAIARELNERGVPGPTGGEWNVSSVRHTIFHPVHSGQVEVPGEGRLVRGQHWEDRFYGSSDYDRIMAEQQRRSRRRGRTEHSTFILSGTATCGLCGRSLVGANKTSRRYQCPRGWTYGVAECDGISCNADELERWVVGQVQELALSPAVQAKAAKQAEAALARRDSQLRDDIAAARRNVQDLERQRERWATLFSSGDIGRERFLQHDRQLQADQDKAQEYLEQLNQQLDNEQQNRAQLDQVREALRDFTTCWGGLDFEQRRKLVSVVTDALTLKPADTGVKVICRLMFGNERQVVIPFAHRRDGRELDGVDALTRAELAVLALLDEGLRPIEISRRRGVSRGCTLTQLCNARKKLGVRSNEEAIELARDRIARESQFLPLGPSGAKGEDAGPPDLTDDQRCVLELILAGHTYPEITEQLGRSLPSIKYFARTLRHKFRVKKRRDLEAEARRRGIGGSAGLDGGEGGGGNEE